MYGLVILCWYSSDGVFLLQWLISMSLFGGQVCISVFDWVFVVVCGQWLEILMVVIGVDMVVFSQIMGWLQFFGILGGVIIGLIISGD